MEGRFEYLIEGCQSTYDKLLCCKDPVCVSWNKEWRVVHRTWNTSSVKGDEGFRVPLLHRDYVWPARHSNPVRVSVDSKPSGSENFTRHSFTREMEPPSVIEIIINSIICHNGMICHLFRRQTRSLCDRDRRFIGTYQKRLDYDSPGDECFIRFQTLRVPLNKGWSPLC